jgi:hypothetical protein
MSVDVRKEENRNRTRDFVKFLQDSTADQLGTFVAFEHDGWLVVASWDGSGFNDRLRDLVASERGKPQTIPPKDPA